MKTAFELAIEISYYAGKLWDIATNPDISGGHAPANYEDILVPQYAEPEGGKTLLSGNVSGLIHNRFEELAALGVAPSEDVTRGSLKASLSTLQRIAALGDPFPGHTTHFSNLQEPLKQQMGKILVTAEKLNLDRA